MTPDTWKRIKSILDKALLLSPAERPSFVREACGDDTEIREEVESLLGADLPTASMERAPAPPDRALGPGDEVASYRVIEEIGRGGMGIVYRVVHTGLDREFALKTLKVASAAHVGIERFQREAKVLGSLKHPHIVDVTDFGIAGGVPYLVMELVSGSTLRQRQADPLSAEEALDVLDALARAVDYAHSKGVLHGDLKPDNVLLTPDGCKILDFGLSRLLGSETDDGEKRAASPSFSDADLVTEFQTMRGVAGTPSYMAPELFSGTKPTIASDLYAIAVLAFEILVGQRPYVLTSEALLAGSWKHPTMVVPSNANLSLPVEVDGPLKTALSEDPAARPPSARELARQLREAVERGRLRIVRKRALPSRALVSLGLAAVVGLSSGWLWNTRWCRGIENRILDAKWALLPETRASSDMLVATIDDRWLAAHPESLSQQGDVLSAQLSSLFSAGARALALDVVLPTEWSEAEDFSRLVLSHADRLTLAAFGSFADGTIRGQECIHPVIESILGPERFERLFGLVNLEADDDGMVRRGRWGFADRDGRVHLSWASRAALTLREGLDPRDRFFLDQTLPIDSIPKISLQELPGALASDPDLVRDKLVIVGATYEGSADTFFLPSEDGKDRSFPGAFVQASLVHTLISGVSVKQVGDAWLVVITSILVAVLGVLLSLPGSPPMYLLAPVASLLLLAGASIAAFRWLHLLIPTAGPMVSLGIGIAATMALRRFLP